MNACLRKKNNKKAHQIDRLRTSGIFNSIAIEEKVVEICNLSDLEDCISICYELLYFYNYAKSCLPPV